MFSRKCIQKVHFLPWSLTYQSICLGKGISHRQLHEILYQVSFAQDYISQPLATATALHQHNNAGLMATVAIAVPAAVAVQQTVSALTLPI